MKSGKKKKKKNDVEAVNSSDVVMTTSPFNNRLLSDKTFLM